MVPFSLRLWVYPPLSKPGAATWALETTLHASANGASYTPTQAPGGRGGYGTSQFVTAPSTRYTTASVL